MIDPTADPRQLKGAIVGDDEPHGTGTAVLDTSNAVLLQDVVVSTVDPDQGGRGNEYFALLLGGRVNQTREQAEVLFIMNTDGAAAVVTQLLGLLGRSRAKPEVIDQFVVDLRNRLDEMAAEGVLTAPDEELHELRITADIIDAIDPALSEEQQMDAAYRARRADPVTALAIALGILSGFVEETHKMDPTVVAHLRANAAKTDWPQIRED